LKVEDPIDLESMTQMYVKNNHVNIRAIFFLLCALGWENH
jgi:hypothetical protein